MSGVVKVVRVSSPLVRVFSPLLRALSTSPSWSNVLVPAHKPMIKFRAGKPAAAAVADQPGHFSSFLN